MARQDVNLSEISGSKQQTDKYQTNNDAKRPKKTNRHKSLNGKITASEDNNLKAWNKYQLYIW